MFRNKLYMAALAVVFTSPAFAADEDGPKFHFSGYGTIGVAHQNIDSADYVRFNQPRKSDIGLDSNLGLQMNVEYNKMFSSTVQVLTRRDYSNDFKPALEWAFVKAIAAPGVTVRAGRVSIPAYLVSDSRNIGYANIAIRPPIEVYSQLPLSSLNGADLTLQKDIGDVALTTQIGYGRLRNLFDGGVTVVGSKTLSLNITAETGPFTFRAAHVRSKVSMYGSGDLDAVTETLREIGYDALADRLKPINSLAYFSGVGMSMDYKNILLQTEYTKRVTESYIVDNTGKYVLLGYRLGKFVPYVGAATIRVDSPQKDDTIPRVEPLTALADGNDTIVNGEAQTTTTLGLRWNFSPSASFKVQADFVKPKQGTNGFLLRVQPAYHGETVRVLSAAVDFVF